jgi:phosphatidylserine decarboxylase
MIKFGSRVDVFLPLSVDLKTNTGDITIAGETILGEFLQSGLEKKSK